MKLLLWMYLGGLLLGSYLIAAQEEFSDAIECYTCVDEAHNTSCSHPTLSDLGDMERVTCKSGACIKWTYYENHILMLYRTCSLKIDIQIHLSDSCRTEGYGNGFLCMCSKDFCNAANKNSAVARVWILGLMTYVLRYVMT